MMTHSIPHDLPAASAFLRQLDVPDNDKSAAHVLHRFNMLARDGYDLNAAPAAATYWALHAFDKLAKTYTIDKFSTTTQSQPPAYAGGNLRSFINVTQGGHVQGVSYHASKEAKDGAFSTLYDINARLLREYFGVNKVPVVAKRAFDVVREGYRVTLALDNGIVTQHVAADAEMAGLMALKVGFDMHLRDRKGGYVATV